MSVSVSSELRLLPDLIAPPQPRLKADRRNRSRADRRFNPIRNDLEPMALVGKDRRDKERRATDRVEIALDCVERLGSQRFFRITHDLSTFGLSTAAGPSHPMGTKLSLALHLPDGQGEPVFVEAVVVGFHTETGGMRLAFRQPTGEVVKRIHRFVKASAA